MRVYKNALGLPVLFLSIMRYRASIGLWNEWNRVTYIRAKGFLWLELGPITLVVQRGQS